MSSRLEFFKVVSMMLFHSVVFHKTTARQTYSKGLYLHHLKIAQFHPNWFTLLCSEYKKPYSYRHYQDSIPNLSNCTAL